VSKMLLADNLRPSGRIRKEDGGCPDDLLLEKSLMGERVKEGGRDLVRRCEGVRPRTWVPESSGKRSGVEAVLLSRKADSLLIEELRLREPSRGRGVGASSVPYAPSEAFDVSLEPPKSEPLRRSIDLPLKVEGMMRSVMTQPAGSELHQSGYSGN